jgi:phosphatidylinositol glycan class B
LIVVLVMASAVRALLAYYDHSIFWPDEIHQSLEQAHRAAFGYGLVPWEFRDGARSWVFPGVIAGLWKLAAGAGVDSSLTLVLLARLAMVAASVVAIWFAAKLASAVSGARAGLASAVVLALFPPAVAFAYRAMSETASAPLIALGTWYLYKRGPRAASLAGLAIGMGCLLRYQNGLFAVVFPAALLLQRRRREALAFCLAGAGVSLFGGLLDWITWGSPFHSLLTYVDFNLILGGASDFGVEPFSFYFTTLWSSVGPMLVPLVAACCIGAAAEPMLGGALTIYLLAHCVLPHKELRFLVPCLPLFATLTGIGVERVLRRVPRVMLAASAATTALSAAFGYALVRLDYADMGQYLGTERAQLPVWQSDQEPTLLLADAGERADLCGVAVLGARAAFTGAYTYLHRDVPLLYQGELCNSGSANYVIRSIAPTGPTLPAAYVLQAQRGSWGLFRRDGLCRPPLEADDRLLEGARDMGLFRRQAKQAADGSLHFDLRRDSGSFERSWGHGELIDCEMARWATGKRAVLSFDFEPGDMRYQLNLRARPHDRALPQTLNVAINGERLLRVSMSPTLEYYSIDLPERGLRVGANRVEFQFGRVGRAGANDARELAALFRSIEIMPKHDDFSIDVALADARSHLVRGFNGVEKEGELTFAWSDGPVSEVEGTLAWPRSPYLLETLAEAIPLAASQSTRVFANEQLVGTLHFQKSWQAQRLLIPAAALAAGKNRLRFEYQTVVRPAALDRKLSDRRELAARFRRIQLTPVAASSSLDFGTPSARPFLLEGWSGDERDGERSAVWSDGPRASLVLAFGGIAKPILRLSAQGYGRALPIAVSVSLNGNEVGAFAAPDGWQDIAVPLPIADYSTRGELLTFRFDHTERPSDHNPQSRDRRQLALRVDRIWVESEDSGGTISASVRALNPELVKLPDGIAASR